MIPTDNTMGALARPCLIHLPPSPRCLHQVGNTVACELETFGSAKYVSKSLSRIFMTL